MKTLVTTAVSAPIENGSMELDAAFEEMQLEEAAVNLLNQENFTKCLRNRDIAESRIVTHGEKQAVLRGEDISEAFESYLYAHFSLKKKPKEERNRLFKEKRPRSLRLAPIFADAFFQWLTESYTDRYKWITTQEQQRWLKHVCLYAVQYRILEYKHWATQSGKNAFLSTYARDKFTRIMDTRHAIEGFYESIGKKTKDIAGYLRDIKDGNTDPELIDRLESLVETVRIALREYGTDMMKELYDYIKTRPIIDMSTREAQRQVLLKIAGFGDE